MELEDEMDRYVKTISKDELVKIINALEDYELVSAALIELGNRDEDKMVEMANDIFIKQKGDKYLQGLAFTFAYSKQPALVLRTLDDRVSTMDEIVLGDVMEELVVDCFQEISSQFTPELLTKIRDRYAQFDSEKKSHIGDVYLEFMKVYGDRMQ